MTSAAAVPSVGSASRRTVAATAGLAPAAASAPAPASTARRVTPLELLMTRFSVFRGAGSIRSRDAALLHPARTAADDLRGHGRAVLDHARRRLGVRPPGLARGPPAGRALPRP